MTTVCDNCGAERSGGRFCPACGQNDRVYLRAVIPVIGDLIATTLDIDSRLWRTLKGLFLKPGFLAEEFSKNRRANYIPPLRLYLVASVALFFTISLQIRGVDLQGIEINEPIVVGDELTDEERETVDEALRQAGLEEVLDPDAELTAIAETLIGLEGDEAAGATAREIAARADAAVADIVDAAQEVEAAQQDQAAAPADESDDGELTLIELKEVLGKEAADKIDVIVDRPWGLGALETVTFDLDEQPTEFELFIARQFVEALYRPEQALDQLVETVPIVMFFVLPLFAFGLKVLYFSKHRYYVEHLVFATHVHTVAFVAFTVIVLELDARIDTAIFVLLFLHYFLSLKRYYNDKFGWAFVKFGFALLGYNFLLIPASVGVFFGTLMLV